MLKFNENGKFTIMVATDIHEKADVTSAKAKKKMRDRPSSYGNRP